MAPKVQDPKKLLKIVNCQNCEKVVLSHLEKVGGHQYPLGSVQWPQFHQSFLHNIFNAKFHVFTNQMLFQCLVLIMKIHPAPRNVNKRMKLNLWHIEEKMSMQLLLN